MSPIFLFFFQEYVFYFLFLKIENKFREHLLVILSRFHLFFKTV